VCKKLFAAFLVLGLVSSAMAAGPDLLIHYTMDAGDSRYGYQCNYGRCLDSIGNGEETFLATNNGYAPGMFGEAVVLSLDGALNPAGYNPNTAFWLPPNEEAGNIIDITPEAESLMHPFENKTILLWFMQTAQRDASKHHPGNDGTEYLLGSYWTYSTYIAFRPGAEEGDPDVLGFRAGATSSTAGGGGRTAWHTVDIAMDTWYHVAMVLENTDGPTGYNGRASFYVNGELIGSEGGLCRSSDAFRYGGLTPWRLAAIGGYQCDEAMTTGHCTGALVDDFGIIDVALGSNTINYIYQNGLMGMGLPVWWNWGWGPGDFVCPYGVDMADFSFFAAHWMRNDCGTGNGCGGTDLDFDGDVDFNDLKELADNWLEGV
jgi:hypothetical protein